MSEHEFDPDEVWDDMEPDWDYIARRDAAKAEQDIREAEEREAAEHKRQLERQQRAEEERARELELEREKEQTAATNREIQDRRDAALDLEREKEYLAQKTRLEEIKAYELRVNRPGPSKWMEPVTHRELRTTEYEAAEMRRLPKTGKRQLPDPFLDEVHGGAGGGRNEHRLDELHPAFAIEGGMADHAVYRQYRSLCAELYMALDTGLYAFDNNLAKNLWNPHTRRLRSYYQNIKRGRFEGIDLEDGWIRLFQLALVIVPKYSYGDKSGARSLANTMRRISEHFTATTWKLKEYCRINLSGSDTTTVELKLLTAVFRTAIRLSEGSDASELHAATRKRSEDIISFIDSNSDRPDVASMRTMTWDIITKCAKYFADNPADASVARLRSIALGRSKIDFGATKRAWVDAIKTIPEAALPACSQLWTRPVEHAGMQPGLWGAKSYSERESYGYSRYAQPRW